MDQVWVLWHEVYSMRFTAQGLLHAVYSMKFTAYGLQHEAYSLQHTVYSMRLTACGLQLVVYTMQFTAWVTAWGLQCLRNSPSGPQPEIIDLPSP